MRLLHQPGEFQGFFIEASGLWIQLDRCRKLRVVSLHSGFEISRDLKETNAISPPRPFLGLSPKKRGEGSKHKDVGKDEAFDRG